MIRLATLLLALCGCLRDLPFDARGFNCAADRDCGDLRCVAGRCQDLTRPELRWAPPPLENPIHVDLDLGESTTDLEASKDYVIHLPRSLKVGQTTLNGGRNVVIIGGELTVAADASTAAERRTLYLNGVSGVAHLEGLVIHGRQGMATQAVVINSRDAIVQIENVRAQDVHGLSPSHGWLATAWGGAREIRVDRFSGTSSSGGFDVHYATAVGAVTLSRVDLAGLTPTADDGTKLLLFLHNGTCDGSAISLSDLFLSPAASRTLPDVISPVPGANGCPFAGAAQQGTPPQGPFVPEGAAGIDYVSPGYLPR